MNDFSTYLLPYFNRGNLHYDLKDYELALIDYSDIKEIYLKQYNELSISILFITNGKKKSKFGQKEPWPNPNIKSYINKNIR